MIQRTDHLLRLADLYAAAADVLRPVEVLTPSAWAERYREVAAGPFRGRWDNANGPHLVAIMDAVQEAIRTGRDLVVMKGAQEGVTEALGVNAVAWLLHYYGGPILYLTAKDDTAKKLSRQRWEPTLATCEPLRAKHLAGKSRGEMILSKRFVDGSLDMCGSKSMNNFISNPYAIVVFDELDACQEEMADGSDPVATIRERMTAFAEGRDVLLIAFAHPTTKERGAAKIYYSESDQRRAHVRCPHCSALWAPLWKDVKVSPNEGQGQAQAERDPTRYELVHEACGAVLSDAERLRAIEHVEQVSTLPPEVARTKRWIGLHVWHLFLRKRGRVERLARDYVAGLDDPGAMITFRNKVLGDAYDFGCRETTVEAWQALQTDAYEVGQVPPEVSFLTSGQDSKQTELHWLVVGWGLVRTTAGLVLLCGWLIDAGVEDGPAIHQPGKTTMDAADLAVFDQILYDALWKRVEVDEHVPISMGMHDSGWQPIAAYEYAATHLGLAIPSKGAAEDDRARAPVLQWRQEPKWKIDGEEISVPDLKRADLNTFILKTDLVGQVTSRFAPHGGSKRPRLALPASGLPPGLLQQLASERLVTDADGKKRWKARGPNHWFDCFVQAYAAALQLAPFLNGETRAEHLAKARAEEEERAARELAARRAPAAGGPVAGPPSRPRGSTPRRVPRRHYGG